VPVARSRTSGKTLPSGTWVELQLTVLAASQRPSNIPSDTRSHDFVARVRGFLLEPARLGEEARIRSLAGREIRGRLDAASPRNPADFGDPVAELLQVGVEQRARLEAGS
jgi:hypothetical protein